MAKKSKPESGSSSEVRGVDLTEVKRLLAFMQENGLEEFEYEKRGVHIRLKKAGANPADSPRSAPAAEVAEPPGAAHTASPSAKESGHAEGVHIVKSPIVGTFYARPSPEADAFVTVGARVETGQVLCIIEAMKLMNEIESDVAGEVVQIFIENGHPVEYGESLFGIRPHGKK